MMRRTSAAVIGSMALAAAVASCGPPPPELEGNIKFARSCSNGSGGCGASTLRLSGANNSPAPANFGKMYVSCQIYAPATGNPRVRFSIGTSVNTNDPSQGYGFSVCGNLTSSMPAATGTNLAMGNITVFLNGPKAVQNLDNGAGPCSVQLLTLGTDGFTGRLKCSNLPDMNTPVGNNTIQGIGGETADPDWADFTFTTCQVTTSAPNACPRLAGS